jgi:beta-xylosidase
LQAGKGLIDPCPLWDDDGQAYLVHAYAFSRSGNKHMLRVCPMAPDATKLLGEGQIVYHNPQRHPTLEGPKFLKRDGWYYLSAPAGGVEHGWQVVLRSRHVYGPYEDKIVLEQGATAINGPHQGALVDTAGGDWWFVHFQDAGAYGRIIHLQPVHWRDGWPLMGICRDGVCEPVLQHAKPGPNGVSVKQMPQTSDEFDSPVLGLQWQWQANHQANWFEPDPQNRRLRLFPQWTANSDLTLAPNVLSQKFPARSFTVETRLHFAPEQAGEEAGLIVVGGGFASLTLRRTAAGNQIILRMNDQQELLQNNAPDTVRFRVSVNRAGECRFGFAGDADWISAPQSFVARKGAWIGAKVGLYSLRTNPQPTAGSVAIDYFRFQ